MKEPTQQQKWLGWEAIDLSQQYILCMWQFANLPPTVRCGHHTLTSALHCNGNLARNWKVEGGAAEETTYGKGQWLLDVEGTPVRLFVDHIDRSGQSPVSIEFVAVQHEKGRPGLCRDLIDNVHQLR